jgi:equilibrative nucleoside transporter 1/2/3
MEFCGTAYETDFLNYFAMSFQVSQMVGLILSIKYQHLIPLVKRIYVPLIIYCGIFFFTSIFVVVHMDPNLLFFITLLCTWICGLCGAFLTGALYGYGAVFPAKYTGALMSGQSLGGLTVSLASFLTIISHTAKDECGEEIDGTCEYYIDYSALTFFILSTIILASAIVVFAVLESLPFSKYDFFFLINHAKSERNLTF